METKKDILWRSYLIYIMMLVLGACIFAKAFYIQNAEGAYWRSLSDSLHLEYREMDAERGTIYSEDGRMLSSSIPFFDIYLDFGAEGIQEKNGERLKQNIDSLAFHLSLIIGEKSPLDYKRELMDVFNRQDRYHLLTKNIDFNQYQQLRGIGFIRKNKNKNGFIFIEKEKRLTPFGLLANRTIGLSREYLDSSGNLVTKNVGLEKTYDSLLKGVTGKRLVRRIAGGAFVPVEGSEIEPDNGKDISTTLDINIQDIAEQALLKVMSENECTNGTCIVMEVKTGKIKAIANLGRQTDGSYAEDLNYAITRSEPGSTFKLITMLSALDDQFINLSSHVNIEGGKWEYGGRTVWDSERHNRTDVTYQQAFELSSNVGMAKLAVNFYGRNPSKFISHLEKLQLNKPTGIDLMGESRPSIPRPGDKFWSNVSLPWMGFGYSVAISPLQTLMVYNAVANQGKMMRPYLVNAIMKDGAIIKEFKPTVINDSICSQQTLRQLKACLEGVVVAGTAKSIYSAQFPIAGKTGTAQVANGNKGYTEHIYQSSFAGYFPLDRPKYSCIVVIKNKPFAAKYYGAQIAGPVFRTIADKLYTIDKDLYKYYKHPAVVDTSKQSATGKTTDFRLIAKQLQTKKSDTSLTFSSNNVSTGIMPALKGYGLKDALEILESEHIQVIVNGKGKVNGQSIPAGMPLQKGQTVYLNLGNKTDLP
ncbi:MAG: PASTA domain-containing protein [Chitinophagia bacterium]|nr:PASTA domain-containing protein [Chitinophagia bacterium]